MVGVCEAARPPMMRAMSVFLVIVDRKITASPPARCQNKQCAADVPRPHCFRIELPNQLLIGLDQRVCLCLQAKSPFLQDRPHVRHVGIGTVTGFRIARYAGAAVALGCCASTWTEGFLLGFGIASAIGALGGLLVHI